MPALAVIARELKALSPARATLAQLLAQAEMLRVETEPLAEQLARCDGAAARADRALADRDALLAEYDHALAETIASGAPRPDPPAALDEAEIELRIAETDARAIIEAVLWRPNPMDEAKPFKVRKSRLQLFPR